MSISIEDIILTGALLLLLSIVAGKRAYDFGVPTLLVFLGVGMLAGSEGVGGIDFDNPYIAQFVGIVCLNFILFSGGLDTNWKSVKPILKHGLVLSTLGVLLTAVSLGLFVYWITDFTIYESMLLGSIVSSTDAAAVFSILRSKSLSLKNNLRPTLELESGSNDPMAYVLTLAFLTLVIHQDQSIWSVIPTFFQQMILGGILGFVFGRIDKYIINNIKLGFEGLYPVLVIALMLITFSATDFFGGNGFLAIYISAVYLGNQDIIHKRTILKMYDGLAWLMQIVLFLTLGLLVFPSEIIPVLGVGVMISLFLILVARPLSVFISTLPFKIGIRSKLYISWVGLRGAVPIVFATYPLLAGIDKANMIFNIVFFISVSSVLLQGTTLSIFAKWLKVAIPEDEQPKNISDSSIDDSELPKATMQEVTISETSKAVNKKIVDLGLPDGALIAIIRRNNEYLTPNGSTIIEPHDKLTILSDDKDTIEEAKRQLDLA